MSRIHFLSDEKKMCINDGKTFTELIPPCSSNTSCDFALWDGITWLTSRPISFTASRCCYGHTEMPEESLLSKYFCIITVIHDCIPKEQHPPPKAMTVTSARSEVIYVIWKLLNSVASPIFFVIFCATGYQEVGMFISIIFPNRQSTLVNRLLTVNRQ